MPSIISEEFPLNENQQRGVETLNAFIGGGGGGDEVQRDAQKVCGNPKCTSFITQVYNYR